MGKILLKANVRLNGEVPVKDEEYQNILSQYKDHKEFQKVCKADMIRAFKMELGFKDEEINVTKFEFTYVTDDECEAPIEEKGAEK